jgi:acetyltransferase-like isoleucine patch superfamily enzyme
MPASPIISPNVRIRCPEQFIVGAGSIVDDFCYFSTRVELGRGCHVASGCSVAGGRERLFRLGDFSSLSSGVKVWCTSNDFARDLVCIVPPGLALGDEPIAGDVMLERYTGVGANSVILPDNRVPEGTVIGALGFVPPRFRFEPWTVYAGAPLRRIGPRDRERVLAQAARLAAYYDDFSPRRHPDTEY